MEKLLEDIQKFEAFRQRIDREQLTYPLDKTSTDILNYDVPIVTGDQVVPAGIGTYDEAIEVNVNGKLYWLYSSVPF